MLGTIERLEGSSLEEIMLDSYRWNKPLYNRAAQVWNHRFYFNCMTSNYHPPSRSLLERIKNNFGSFDRFELDFRKAGNSAFGSGWAWLVYDALTQKLVVTSTIGADTPMMQNENHWPILTMDVWEHAYYFDYQNRRKDYTKAFINHLVDWTFVEETLSRVEVESVIAAEKREQARLEEELARLEREKQEAEVAAQLARVERARLEAEAEAARQETKRLEIEAASEAARRIEEERIDAEIDTAKQEQERLDVEVVTDDAKLEEAEKVAGAETEEHESTEAEAVAHATSEGTGNEKLTDEVESDEIFLGKEVSSEAENEEEPQESINQWWSVAARASSSIFDNAARVYTSIFGNKANSTTQEGVGSEVVTDAAPTETDDAAPTEMEEVDVDTAKPEEVPAVEEEPSEHETMEEVPVEESTNPFVRYPARVGRFFLGILWFILRVLHLILKIIFI
jgi:Fe-Mn family superoxide dismutase